MRSYQEYEVIEMLIHFLKTQRSFFSTRLPLIARTGLQKCQNSNNRQENNQMVNNAMSVLCFQVQCFDEHQLAFVRFQEFLKFIEIGRINAHICKRIESQQKSTQIHNILPTSMKFIEINYNLCHINKHLCKHISFRKKMRINGAYGRTAMDIYPTLNENPCNL